jgi:nitroimidazol reductase NimA-like FMN-containing flavoprotein (pyridoxamine 5'-phosphate oxidase superfamily)
MEVADLVAEHQRLGAIVHLATITPDGDPHVAPVHTDWMDDCLYAMVGTGARKTRNIAVNPSVSLHYQVGADTGWDSLMIWGRASVLDSLEDKRRLWDGVFSYDLNLFSPGGPDDSPDTCFIEIVPERALVLRRFGMDGREEWWASPTTEG